MSSKANFRYSQATSLLVALTFTGSCKDDASSDGAGGAANDASASMGDAAPLVSTNGPALFDGTLQATSESSASASESPGGDNSGAAVEPIGHCADAVGGSESPVLDDFEDGNTTTLEVDGRAGTWYFYDDETTGTRQSSVSADPLGNRDGLMLSVSGSGFSNWGSGFGAGLRWNTTQCTYDASAYSGIQFWLRGSGQGRVTFQNTSVRPVALGGDCPTDAACFDSHGVALTIPAEWTRVQLPFADFEQAGWGTSVGPLDTSALYLLEFQFGTNSEYSLWLDDVAFYHAESAPDAGASGASQGNDTLPRTTTDDPSTSSPTASPNSAHGTHSDAGIDATPTTTQHPNGSFTDAGTSREGLASDASAIDAMPTFGDASQ